MILMCYCLFLLFFFFKQMTAYGMCISDWSSDVCSSDLLWHTGGMHNRVRMVVASFLCKNLRIHWSPGARWFWDTLLDADLAANTRGWQWSAGTGDRRSVVWGKSVQVRLDHGGGCTIKNQRQSDKKHTRNQDDSHI